MLKFIKQENLDHLDFIVICQIKMAYETEKLKLDKQVVRQGVRFAINSQYADYFIAFQSNKPIATLMITYEWSDWRNQFCWWIQSVYVTTELRGQGVFKNFYQYIQNLSLSSETVSGLRLYVDKTNFKAKEVYHKVKMNNDHYELFEWMKSF